MYKLNRNRCKCCVMVVWILCNRRDAIKKNESVYLNLVI